MTFFGKNGFVRRQEVEFAKKLLVWKYEKSGTPRPGEASINAHAEKIVEDAHLIAKKTGNSVLDILKEAVKNFKNKNR